LVCYIYQFTDLKQQKSIEQTLGKLRWKKYLASSNIFNLPPTENALLLKAKRANYTTALWQCHLQDPPELDLNTSGCEIIPHADGFTYLIPMTTTNGVAPPEILSECRCHCKTGCQNNRCKCRKNGRACTELCAPCNGEDNLCDNSETTERPLSLDENHSDDDDEEEEDGDAAENESTDDTLYEDDDDVEESMDLTH
jgi:hypothetical protein